MSHKKLAIIGIVAVGMMVWAIIQSNLSNRPAGGGVEARANLLQGFDPAAIGSIVIKAGGNTVTLLRQGGVFVVAEKSKYPAMMKMINYLLTSCLDIQTAELITSDKTNFADLGVGDDKPEKAIHFFRPDKSLIAGILIGKAGKDSQGTYVRLASSGKAYLSTNVPLLHTEAMDYIDRTLTEVRREDIVMVRVEDPAGNYVLTKGPNGVPVLENIPVGKRANADGVAQVFAALTNLTFDHVKPDSGSLKFGRTYVCQLKDSTVYTIDLKLQGEKTYARLTADFLDKSGVVKKFGVESDAELKEKEAKLLARDKATDFAKRTQGWVYDIAEPAARRLMFQFADLTENEPPKPADPNSAKK